MINIWLFYLLYKKLNSSLNSKVGNFTSGNYKAVTGLAYDSTNNKLGLKVGADTVIPFSSGSGNACGSLSMRSYGGQTVDITFDVSNISKIIIAESRHDNSNRYWGIRFDGDNSTSYSLSKGRYLQIDVSTHTIIQIYAYAGSDETAALYGLTFIGNSGNTVLPKIIKAIFPSYGYLYMDSNAIKSVNIGSYTSLQVKYNSVSTRVGPNGNEVPKTLSSETVAIKITTSGENYTLELDDNNVGYVFRGIEQTVENVTFEART